MAKIRRYEGTDNEYNSGNSRPSNLYKLFSRKKLTVNANYTNNMEGKTCTHAHAHAHTHARALTHTHTQNQNTCIYNAY